MPRFKNILSIAGFLLIAIVIEFIREKTGLPITIFDLLLFPLVAIIIIFILKGFFTEKNEKSKCSKADLPNLKLVFYICIFTFLLIPLGVCCVWMGLEEPFGYFSGVKGAAHGYTLILLGLVILIISVYAIYLLLLCKLKSKRPT